jgi:hypothetical protein
MREADVSDGSRVPHGSKKHVKDLEARIASLTTWRDKQKRGSESRANYSRLISRLKGELASAKRAAAKKKIKENYAAEPDDEEIVKWQRLLRDKTGDDYANGVIDDFMRAESIEELDRLRDDVAHRRSAGGVSSVLSDGFVSWLYGLRAEKLGLEVRPLQ